MSISHGKQYAAVALIASDAANTNPTRADLAKRAGGHPTMLNLTGLLLYDDSPDHTSAFMRKAKVVVRAGYYKGVIVLATRGKKSRVKGLGAGRHRDILGVLGVGRLGRNRVDRVALVDPFDG